MPLSLIEGPEAGLELVRRHAPLFLSQDYRLTVARPYPLYSIGINAIQTGRPLSAAELTAWQYLLLDQEADVFALAEVADVNAGGKHKLTFSTLRPRRYAEAVVATIVSAEEFSDANEAQYLLRILRAPGIYALAVWLHGNDDIVFPVRAQNETTMKEIWQDRRVVKGERELAQLLRPAAELQLMPPVTAKAKSRRSPRSGKAR